MVELVITQSTVVKLLSQTLVSSLMVKLLLLTDRHPTETLYVYTCTPYSVRGLCIITVTKALTSARLYSANGCYRA